MAYMSGLAIAEMGAGYVGMADLSSRKVVAGGESGGPPVERRLAISHSALREVWERQKTWLLWLTLLLQIAGIHCGERGDGAAVWGWCLNCVGKVQVSKQVWETKQEMIFDQGQSGGKWDVGLVINDMRADSETRGNDTVGGRPEKRGLAVLIHADGRQSPPSGALQCWLSTRRSDEGGVRGYGMWTFHNDALRVF
jgi:hypothetical protein